MSTGLDRIAAKAKADRKVRFTSLAHLLTPEFLKETWRLMNRRGAGGVDGETAKEFERGLEARVFDIWARLKSGRYQAPPVRRVEIPKGAGKTGTRPLGIPTVEDRLVQRAVARILEAIFEPNFLDCSFGFRPGKSPHDALKAVRSYVIGRKVGYVFEADIRGYFDHINHDWLCRMVAHRVADPVILRLISKWLKAGVMRDGVVVRSEKGTPQGGPISPILANVYLHFALDLWFERRFKRTLSSEAFLTRFADDFLVCFQYRQDAQRFWEELKTRFEKFGLELADEKTRLLQFGRFARRKRAQWGEKPETFEFLGFEHVCGQDGKGRFAVIRIPSRKSCRKFLQRTREWLSRHRHEKCRKQQRELTARLRGFYQYFGLHHCKAKLDGVRLEVRRQWASALRRRGSKRRAGIEYLYPRPWFELPYAKTLHPTI